MSPDLARCLREQAEAAAYIAKGGPDTRGAWMGLLDWLVEEMYVREEEESRERETRDT